MKTLFAALFVLAALRCTAQQAGPPKNASESRKQILWMLDNFAPQDTLDSSVQLVMHPETATSKEELDRARNQAGLIPDHVAKLRKLVKPGTSIFDYPGLLTICRIRKHSFPDHPDGTWDLGYELYYGRIKGFVEGETPPAVNIDFNDKGTITAVHDVVIEW